MLLLALTACSDYAIKGPTPEPLALTVTSPTYGAFLGDGPVHVTGVVTPASAFVKVNDTVVQPDDDGNYEADVPFDDRALVVDVVAISQGDQVRQVVPVFDGTDPRLSDPGAIGGLLTPTGLDALEPMIAEQVDALGLLDQIYAVLPTVDTDYVDLVPVSVTSSGTTADLAPGFDSVALSIILHDVTVTTDVTLLDAYTFTLAISLGEVQIGAYATPWVDADGMLGVTLSDAIVDIGDPGLSVDGWEIPSWVSDLLFDPVASLISDLGATLGDVLLDQVGDLTLGGPFAFDFDLLDTSLSARLVDADAGSDGVSLGVTVATGGEAADTMPDVAPLTATTPSGLPYQLGAAVHEGLLNTLLDQTLAGFLDIDLQLEGEYGEMLGGGIAALDGGNDIPDEANGYCLGIHVGDARVIRMVTGTGAPLARAYLPDVRVDIDTVQGSDCVDWLDASLFATVDLSLDGTTVNADFDVKQVALLAYGADGYDTEAVEDQLGAVVEGLAGLFAGDLSFDLGGAIDLGGLSLSPTIVSVEPLDDDGLYGIYMDVF